MNGYPRDVFSGPSDMLRLVGHRKPHASGLGSPAEEVALEDTKAKRLDPLGQAIDPVTPVRSRRRHRGKALARADRERSSSRPGCTKPQSRSSKPPSLP